MRFDAEAFNNFHGFFEERILSAISLDQCRLIYFPYKEAKTFQKLISPSKNWLGKIRIRYGRNRLQATRMKCVV